MWKELKENEKAEYKKMILAFASLTEMFAQKSESSEDDDNENEPVLLSPIINSKYQETVFQKVFNAFAEDIGNTSYDASVEIKKENGESIKCLVGIKTFGISSGNQKIAQFKMNHDEWSDIINEISRNSFDSDGNRLRKDEIDKKNKTLYAELAENIASLRNKRIESSAANLRGFDVKVKTDSIESVYHVLMPSPKGETPYIAVGETSYDKINIDKIKILGCTSAKNPTNFYFSDGNHKYKFTSADSQLLMDFSNRNIVQEKWKVKYAENAYDIFSQIADKVYKQEKESYSWMITNSDGEVERYSGFNGFYGVGAKIKRTDAQIVSTINKLREKYCSVIKENTLNVILERLNEYLKFNADIKTEKLKKEKMRADLLKFVDITKNDELYNEICKLIFRPANEMYIPIPKSRKFHQQHPDFFGVGVGALEKVGTKWKLTKEKTERCFTMVFDPSGDEMEMFIGQDAGKGIESNGRQSILGEWMLEKVFGLNKYEPLTSKKLNEIGINGIRLTKFPDDKRIHLTFVWIDKDNLPEDYIK